jgi:plasmid stabilization system protein ParE
VKKCVLSVGAEQDLEAIWDFIAESSIDQADRWIARLFDAFDLLAQNPGIGHLREDLTSLEILFWPVGSYLVLYRAIGDRIEIVAVTQGARDIPRFLSDRTSL